MASWGNQQGQQFPQDMDSAGQKLNVNGNTGGTSYQAEIVDTNIAGKSLKVDGEQHFTRRHPLRVPRTPSVTNDLIFPL